MNTKKKKKMVCEGHYVAEVEVTLLLSDGGWSPTLSAEDAYRLDEVREALKRGDLRSASQNARVYELHPVAV